MRVAQSPARLLSATLLATAVAAASVPGAAHAQSSPTCAGHLATIVGTEGNDTIVGTDGPDVIVALAGNDRIDGGAGDDAICAGPDATTDASDNDIVDAGDGDDFVLAGAGDDRVTLGAGVDYAETGEGVDNARGGDGEDYIDTGAGDDLADGGRDRDYVAAGTGNDTMTSSGAGPDYLDGGEDADTITGAADTNYIDGGNGSDRIDSPSGYLAGGAGNDTITGGNAVSYVEAGDGNDTVTAPSDLEGGPGADVLAATGEGSYANGGDDDDVLVARNTGVTLDGGAGTDQLNGSSNPDTLLGGAGDDSLDAGAGDDTLSGDDRIDTLQGRAGADELFGGADADTLIGGPDADSFSGGGGTDILRAVDGTTDTSFSCGLTFESDRLVADETADASVARYACDKTIGRVYSPPPEPPRVGALYVALGDSFSSGEGTYLYDNDIFAGPYCHRGSLAWPRRFGRRHFGLADSSIEHRACTGAKTQHMRGPWPTKYQDPQIPSKIQARTELVTFTIGGNDVGFGELLSKVRISTKDVWPSPAANRSQTERTLRERLRTLGRDLKPIYQRLRHIYPNADIVHVGYPRILPSHFGDAAPFRCAWLGRKEQDLADWILDELNATIRDAANASVHNIDYVDVTEALDGHELCAPQGTDAWVNDLALEYGDIPGDNWEGSTERGHPNLDGQYAYADAVAAGLGY